MTLLAPLPLTGPTCLEGSALKAKFNIAQKNSKCKERTAYKDI